MSKKIYSVIVLVVVFTCFLSVFVNAGGELYLENKYYEDGSIKMEAEKNGEVWTTKNYDENGNCYVVYEIDNFIANDIQNIISKKICYQYEGKEMIKSIYMYEWNNEMTRNVPVKMYQYEVGTDKIKYEFTYEFKNEKQVLISKQVFDTTYEGDFFELDLKPIKVYDLNQKSIIK